MRIDISIRTHLRIVPLTLVLGAALSGCGSETATNSSANQKNVTVVVPKMAPNSNTVSNQGKNVNLIPLAGPGNRNSDPTRDNSKVKTIDTSKIKRIPSGRPMPENSELTTTMNPKGEVVETRVFKGGGKLEKIVRTTVSPRDVRLRVHTRDGRTYDLPPESFDIRRVTTAEVLKAIGLKAGSPTGNRRGTGKDNKEGVRRESEKTTRG